MERMVRIVKKLSNDVMDLKKMDSENTTRTFNKRPLK